MPPAIGDWAPHFIFNDATGHERALAEFHATPVIVLLLSPSTRADQPVLQLLRFRGQSIPLIAPADEDVAHAYGVLDDTAIFVVSGGTIVWSRVGDDVVREPPAPSSSGLTRCEFVAAVMAASIATGLTSSRSEFS